MTEFQPLDPRDAERRTHLVVLGTGVVLWQAHAAILAWRNAPELASMLTGLGAELPFVTRSFLATHQFWAIAPVATAVSFWAVARAKQRRVAHSTFALAAGLLVALTMHAWLQEAWFKPILGLMKKIG